MIVHQLALIKRELQEHRSIWITPIAIAIIVTLSNLSALMLAGEFAQHLDMAIFGAQNLAGDAGRKGILTAFFVGSSLLFLFALAVLTVFYALDSLYAERKDKSILFWRSLPVTDAETVISKFATAMVIIPAVAIAAILATHLVNLVITSIWVSSKGGDAGVLIWGSVSLLDNWLAAIIGIYAVTVWMSPFLGWFMFVSAYTKRAPLLMAFMPLVLIPLLERIFLSSNPFGKAVWGRFASIPLFSDIDVEAFFDEGRVASGEMISLLASLDLAKFVTSLDTWVGIIVCGMLITGAIYVRRFRGES